MCTVTRPGLASIASSTVVELLASLLQHPDGLVLCLLSNMDLYGELTRIHAAAPPPKAGPDNSSPDDGGSVLGLVPHQLRGFLAQFRNMHIVGAAYSKCTGCSETVRVFHHPLDAVCLYACLTLGTASVRERWFRDVA